jgi:flagellar hook assembly protein FlgD
MTQITNVNTQNLPVLPNGTAQRQLNQTDFLRLMTTQLREQDPFNPVDNQAMVAQMAQFSSVAGISEMNSSLKSISSQAQAAAAARAQDAAATTRREGAFAARDSVSEVDLDHEAAELLRFQQAYEGAARIIQVARETMQSILSVF